MKKKLGILLVVALFILASITLVSCTMFGGGSSTTERSEIKESHGYPFALEITSPAPSKSSAIGIDEFNLSMVKAKVRYAKTIKGPTGEDVIEYWTDDSSEFTLDNKNVEVMNEWVLSDLEALAQEKNTVFVKYDSNLKDEYGYNAELTGSFVLYLRQSESVSYSKIKFNPNGGIVGFAGSTSDDGSISVTVRTGTSYTWSDFIATYPVTPPSGKALSSWGHYSSGSSIHVDSDMELSAVWTDNFLTVSFAVNNTSTDYTSVPVKPADQPVQIRDGFIARPQTKTMETFNGYDFIDWYKDPECTKKWNFTADLKDNGHTTSENLTLYAKWEERKFTIKFNLMDGLLGSEQLQEIVTGESTTDYVIPTIERSNFSVASYITYTNDAGAVSYISITTTPKASARRLVFNNRQYPLTSSLAAGDYYFDYQAERYYFSTSSALAKSDKGLQIGCAPATVTYSDLKVGTKYFTQDQGNFTGGLLLATGVQNLETSKNIYKGLATFLDANDNNIYFYEFKGWYTSPTFDEETLFTFANGNGTSKEIVLGDYDRTTSGFVLQLYAKWMVVNNEYRDLYLSDYLYKDTLELKADGTVAINGISDTSANIITIPKTIKYDFDGDGEFDKDSTTNTAKDFVITEIGYKAFYGNSKIVEIAFDNDSQITKIGDSAFAYCTSLTNINLFSLNNVNDIGSNILKGTSWLTNYMTDEVPFYVTYTNGTDPVVYINITTTEKVGAQKLVFEELQYALTSPLAAGDYYFEFDNDNYYFTINDELAASETGLQILAGTHEYLVLNHILIQYTGAVPVSGYVNMNQSKELAKINHDNGPTTIIASGAFAGLQKLLVIEILDSIETIQNLAFQGASKLLAVEFTENTHLENVGESAFYQTAWVAGTKEIDESTGTIYTYVMMKEYDSTVSDFYKASDTGEFKEAKEPQNQAEFVKNGPYFKKVEKENKDLCLVLGNIYYRYVGASNKSYTTADIPTTYNGNTITKIAANAFAGYSNIKYIDFGGERIFDSADVKNIVSIGQNAFSDTSWSKISNVPNANDFVEGSAGITYVSQDGFVVVNGILVEYFGSSNAAIIPTNVKYIAKGVLSKKSSTVTNVLIPIDSDLISIDDYAFINASSLRGISFLDPTTIEAITFSEKAFFTSTSGVLSKDGLTFYFTLPSGTIDEYVEELQTNNTWAVLKDYDAKTFKYLELKASTAEINPDLGIPTKYLIDKADPNALDIFSEWEDLANFVIGPYGPTFINGLKITRNDGVSTLQDLYLERDASNYIQIINTSDSSVKDNYKFSASDVPSNKVYATYAIKFYAQGVAEEIAQAYDFAIYPGIAQVEFSGLRSVYYISQNTLPKSGDDYWVKITLYNNKVDYFRLDNQRFEEGPFHWDTSVTPKQKVYETDYIAADATSEEHAETAEISILNYTNTRGPAKSLSISISYNGLKLYQGYSHTYSTEEAAVVSFEQASSFLFAANSNATSNYSNCYFKLTYQDETTKMVSMNMSRNFSVYQVFMESENPYGPKNSYVEMNYLDTTDLGLRQAKIKYEGIDEPVTILYIVYIGTLPEVFTYDFKVVGGEYVATITGISSAFNNTYDSTLVLPASVVRSESIDPLTYDNKEYKVVAIGNSSFKNKTKLTDVYIANTITSIGDYAFAGCEKLVNVYTFEMGTNKSAGLNPTYYYGPNDANNSIEAYSETATYYARAYITKFNDVRAGTSLVVPFTMAGKSGVEEIETNIKMENQQAVYTGATHTYNVNYSYVITPIIDYKYVDVLDENDQPTGEQVFDCILNKLTGFEGGKLYLPKTEYYISLVQKVEEAAGESGLDYTIYLYEENEKDIPTQTTAKFKYKGKDNTERNDILSLEFDIDMCYRTGNVVLLENAALPIADNQVYIPGHFNGNYEASKNVGTLVDPVYDTYDVYYDYTLTSVMDSCLNKSYNDGMREVYVPYTIFNVWCDIDEFLLYAPDMNSFTFDASDPAAVQAVIASRITENYSRVGQVSKYQYTAGSMLTSEFIRSAATGAIVSHTSSYDIDTAYAVAKHFSSAVKVIGESAFAECVLLRYIDFSYAESLEEIGAAAFEGCVAFGKDYDDNTEPPTLVVKMIDLSNTKLESIESNVFSGCTSLESIKIPKTVTSICGGAFQATSINVFKVGDDTSTSASLIICDYAFYLVNIADKDAFIDALEDIYLGGVDVNMDLAFSQGN